MSEKQPYRSDALHPLTETTDAFGHEDYATALCRVVKSVPAPFTLGLFAPWGTGKSLILREATSRLNDPEQAGDKKTAAVVFDVWKYEEDSLRREFIRELGEQLKRRKQLKHTFDLDAHLERFDADIVNFRARLRFEWRALVKAAFHALVGALALFSVLFLVPALGSGITELGAKKVGVGIAGAILTFIFSALAQVIHIEQIQVSRKRLQDSDEFARSFEALLRKGLKAERLVVGNRQS